MIEAHQLAQQVSALISAQRRAAGDIPAAEFLLAGAEEDMPREAQLLVAKYKEELTQVRKTLISI